MARQKIRQPKRKLSEVVAESVINYIRDAGLPPGSDLGTEQDALRMLGVSRGTFREALRQLEWQGVVTVRRGLGGGLRTSMPRAYIPMFTLKLYFELAAINPRRLRRSYRVLQAAMGVTAQADRDNEVLRMLAETVDGRFTAALGDASANAPRATRLSEQTAYRITLEIEDSGAEPGSSIGSEADLIKRLGVGRGVIRETLRLMELNEIIEIRRGVAGGVFVHQASPHFAIYACCVYLTLARIPLRTVMIAQFGMLHALSIMAGGDASLILPADAEAGCGWELDRLATNGIRVAQAADLHPAEVLMTAFLRFWRDFHPEVRFLPLPDGAHPVDGAEAFAAFLKAIDTG
jgi:DNA-binding FadR family transcriptional regulator